MTLPTKVKTRLPAQLERLRPAIEATRRQLTDINPNYAASWHDWETWAAEHGAKTLPADPLVLAVYLNDEAQAGAKYATLKMRLAAISFFHRRADLPSPTLANQVKTAMGKIQKEIGNLPNQRAALTLEDIRRMVSLCSDNLTGIRDRALMLVAFAFGFRGANLLAIRWQDVEIENDLLRITLKTEKNHPEGRVAETVAGENLDTCPVRALQALQAVNDGEYVFRRVHSTGKFMQAHLSKSGAWLAIAKYVAAIGLPVEEYGLHSFRAGTTTTLLSEGEDIAQVAKYMGMKKLDTVRGYDRRKLSRETAKKLGL